MLLDVFNARDRNINISLVFQEMIYIDSLPHRHHQHFVPYDIDVGCYLDNCNQTSLSSASGTVLWATFPSYFTDKSNISLYDVLWSFPFDASCYH